MINAEDKVHYKDDGRAICNWAGLGAKLTINIGEVTCRKCMKSIAKREKESGTTNIKSTA